MSSEGVSCDMLSLPGLIDIHAIRYFSSLKFFFYCSRTKKKELSTRMGIGKSCPLFGGGKYKAAIESEEEKETARRVRGTSCAAFFAAHFYLLSACAIVVYVCRCSRLTAVFVSVGVLCSNGLRLQNAGNWKPKLVGGSLKLVLPRFVLLRQQVQKDPVLLILGQQRLARME